MSHIKKTVLVALTTISLSFQSKYIQDDVSLICSGKWYLEYMEMSGQKMPIPPEMQENSWVIFRSNGKHEAMEMGIKYIGKWKYSKENRSINTVDKDGSVSQKIISISDSKLVLSVNDQGQEMIMGMRK